MTILMETRNLEKVYGEGEAQVNALRPLNLKINKGEFTAIIGASGSGKSTLLNLLGALDRPSKGEVILGGENIYDLKENKLSDLRRKKFGFIFQAFNLIPVLNVEDNIKLPSSIEGDELDGEYIDELIENLGLKKRMNHFPNELSGGQQQRVAIARALAGKPDIIFADEPTGNLDSSTTEEVLEILRKSVEKYNQTLIMITHDMKVAKCADRTITISDGSVIKDERNNESILEVKVNE